MSEAPTSTAHSTEPFGRYRLIEPIARGGMAEVFKAKSFGVEGFEKVLVIKRIVPELIRHRAFVDMFVQEAKLAVRLSHANIVQVFDLGRVEDREGTSRYYIAMEHVAGVDLQTLVNGYRKEKEPMPLGLGVYVASEVAKALDHAHRRQDEEGRALGIVHRDISPHNILLSWDGDVKVTDFGIAKAADTIEGESGEFEAARAAGKLAFMSPEQARSERTDPRSDLFSLGIVLYQLLTGANPFLAPTKSETVRRIQAGEYPPLSLARADVPPELVAIVDDLLRVEPEERIASAAELHERLVAFSYNSGERFGATDLALLLAPLRDRGDEASLVESVLEEPHADADKTPVEIPHPSTPPPPVSEPATGERREVTVLVADLGRGELAARTRQTRRMRELLERHGAWIEEESDEQLVAIFGLGETDGRDAEAGVRTGLVLVRERRDGVVPSAGIHSGPISVDDGGIPVRDERLVNLLATAQRLARAAEGQVVVSPVAARLVRRSYATEPLPESLRAVSDGGLVIRRARAERSERSKFVGRTGELKRLGTIMAAATRREPQLCVVRGETGLGKSRLIEEARRRLERGAYEVAFYAATCPLNGATVPWSGLRAMLHVLCGTQEDDDAARILEVQPRLRALGLDDEQVAQVLSLLGARIKGTPDDARPVLRASFERMVESLSRDRLHCFAFDDAQAIDRETLDAILRIMRRHRSRNDPSHRGGLRAVFILSQRGEVPPSLTRRKELHIIELGELRERDTQRLLESLLGARVVPAPLLEFVRSAAGGHPLFIDELVRELCDIGVVQVLNGKVRMKADATAVAPRTLRTLIADRVSRLQQRERRVLQGLAILGEPAFTPLLSTVLEQALPTLDRNLTRLEHKGLVRRTGPTQVRFASPLYQEIVLDAMTTAAGQELHARAAKAYEDATLPGPGEAAERRAEHLVGAGHREEAVDHFWRSADAKVAADQIEAALRMMVRGLSLCDPAARSVDELSSWLGKVASAVSQIRQCPGLEQAIAEPLRVVNARGSERQRVLAHIHAARALGSINLFDKAFEALSFADPDRLDDDELKGESLMAEAQLSARQGLFKRAAHAGDRLEALGLADTPHTVMILALAKAMVGDGDQAKVLMQRVESMGEPSDVIDAVVRKKHWVLVYFNSRDFERASSAAIELSALARSAGLRFDCAAAQHNLGDIYDRLGDPARAYAAFLESLELTRLLEHDRLTNLNQMHLAFLDGLRGDGDAEERLKVRIRYADAKGFLWDVLEGRFLVARLSAARGDIARAKSLITDVIALAREHGQNLILVDAEELLATLG